MTDNHSQETDSIRYYFIDEGGDGTLFSKRGKVGRYRDSMSAMRSGIRIICGKLFWSVQDIDDRREAGYGVYYTQKKPLNAATLEWRRANKKPRI